MGFVLDKCGVLEFRNPPEQEGLVAVPVQDAKLALVYEADKFVAPGRQNLGNI